MESKKIIIILFFLLSCFASVDLKAQGNDEFQKLFEFLTENMEGESDVLNLYDNLMHYKDRPIDLNKATAVQLQDLGLLSPSEINAIINHRKIFGDYLAIYELQTIPSLSKRTINLIKPFVQVKGDISADKTPLKEMFSKSLNEVFILTERRFPASEGYLIADTINDQEGTDNSYYRGSPYRLMTRYRMSYGQRMKLGFTAEKDAGEEFFEGSNPNGFDFYGFHFFLGKFGMVDALALGDFQANFGQGLVMGTGLGFGKSAYVMSIKRNNRGIEAYRSLRESNFFRGAATTLKFGNFYWSLMGSRDKLDANVIEGDTTDGLDQEAVFSAIGEGGLHRTFNEIGDKQTVTRNFYATDLTYKTNRAKLGITALYNKFSHPLSPSYRTYNKFYYRGNEFSKAGINFDITYKNANFFGEAAIGSEGGTGISTGVLLSAGPTIDFSFLYRNFSKDFNFQLTNPVMESSSAVNEKGFYMGMVFMPTWKFKVSSYFDIYEHPWLRFQTDAPSKGWDFLTEAEYKPTRALILQARYKIEQKLRNSSNDNATISFLIPQKIQVARFNAVYKVNKSITLRSRFEYRLFRKQNEELGTGNMIYQDLIIKPLGSPVNFYARASIFNIDDFDARIYAFENVVLYDFPTYTYNGVGMRYYAMLRIKFLSNFDVWLRYSRTDLANAKDNILSENYTNPNATTIGTGRDEIIGNTISELTIQLRWRLDQAKKIKSPKFDSSIEDF